MKSDMWALGIIMYELCTCKRPFEANNQCALILKIIRGEYVPIPPERASSDLINFTNQLLSLDQKTRPSAKRLLSHPRIQEEFKVLGLELPEDIELCLGSPNDHHHHHHHYGPSSYDNGSSSSHSPSKSSRIVSSRLENLAQPRKEVSNYTTHIHTVFFMFLLLHICI
jgi:serine/threonine protein kinase